MVRALSEKRSAWDVSGGTAESSRWSVSGRLGCERQTLVIGLEMMP